MPNGGTNIGVHYIEDVDLKTNLRSSTDILYCSTTLIHKERIKDALEKGLKGKIFDSQTENGFYTNVNYLTPIDEYIDYMIDSISDEDGNISFGMINDIAPEETLKNTFIQPLLELLYDFISQYQDESLKSTKESLDFILYTIELLKKIDNESFRLDYFEELFRLFHKTSISRNKELYFQLSLYAIRESIEQPIGSPKLKYKNQQISELISTITEEKIAIVFYKEGNLYNYFIPALENELLEKYLNNLETHLYESFYDKFHKDGQIVTRVIYFESNDKIDEFRKNLLYKDGDTNQPEPIYTLHKIDVVDFESFQLNFGGQIRDFIDSVSKISLIGCSKSEQSILGLKKEDNTINLKEIIRLIGDRPWTEKKETIRTIEHYRKLLFDGENSAFKLIQKIANTEYKTKLKESVCKEEEFKSNVWEYSYLDKLIKDESESYDTFTIDLALLYLFENKSIDENIRQLLELCKNDYKFEVDKDEVTKAVNFKNLFSILTKNKRELEFHLTTFDLNSSFTNKLSTFTDLLINENKINSLDEYFSFLNSKQENGFIKSYHNALGGYLLPELTDTL